MLLPVLMSLCSYLVFQNVCSLAHGRSEIRRMFLLRLGIPQAQNH
jgi:hypothetical protein